MLFNVESSVPLVFSRSMPTSKVIDPGCIANAFGKGAAPDALSAVLAVRREPTQRGEPGNRSHSFV